MDQQQITELILTIINNYLPAIVAIVVSFCAMYKAIKTCKSVGENSTSELKASNRRLANELAESKKENRKLTKLLEENIASNRKIIKPESKEK